MSDHYPVGISWKIRNRWSEGYHKVMEYRKVRQINSEVFSLNIEKSLKNELNDSDNVNTKVILFTDIIIREMDKTAPKLKRHKKQLKWFTKEIEDFIKKEI